MPWGLEDTHYNAQSPSLRLGAIFDEDRVSERESARDCEKERERVGVFGVYRFAFFFLVRFFLATGVQSPSGSTFVAFAFFDAAGVRTVAPVISLGGCGWLLDSTTTTLSSLLSGIDFSRWLSLLWLFRVGLSRFLSSPPPWGGLGFTLLSSLTLSAALSWRCGGCCCGGGGCCFCCCCCTALFEDTGLSWQSQSHAATVAFVPLTLRAFALALQRLKDLMIRLD